jgi:hypothetical protein
MKRHAPPGLPWGVSVPGSRDAEGVGLGNRFSEQAYQRVADARVLDASGRKKKLHHPSLSDNIQQ